MQIDKIARNVNCGYLARPVLGAFIPRRPAIQDENAKVRALSDSDKIQGYRSGAVDYISVPVVPEVLRAKISIFVELHRKTRMLETLNNQLEQRVAERTDELRQQRRDKGGLVGVVVVVQDQQKIDLFGRCRHGERVDTSAGQLGVALQRHQVGSVRKLRASKRGTTAQAAKLQQRQRPRGSGLRYNGGRALSTFALLAFSRRQEQLELTFSCLQLA